jgi:putative 2OG-Fe(II) oxygenase
MQTQTASAAPSEVVDELAERGFVKIEGLTSADQTAAAQHEGARLLSQPPTSWDQFVPWSKAATWKPLLLGAPDRDITYFDFLGVSPILDAFVEAIVAQQVVQVLLAAVLGAGYRMWFCQLRQTNPNGQALRIHQDLPGELTLSILLSNIRTMAGTTVFLPGSHRWPLHLGAVPLYPQHVTRWLRGATGVPGDAYVFYNSTWHGRPRARGANTAILLSFLPPGARQGERHPPADVLEKLGPALQRMMSPAAAGESRGPATEALRQILANEIPIAPLSPWHAVRFAAGAASAGISGLRRARGWVRR